MVYNNQFKRMILLKKKPNSKALSKTEYNPKQDKKNESPKNIGLNPNANVCIHDNYFLN